jgi:hypothetical protein
MGHMANPALAGDGADFLSLTFGFRDSGRGRRLTMIGEHRHASESAARAAAQEALLCGAVGAVVAQPAARGPKPLVLHRFGQVPAPLRPAAVRIAA